MQSSRRTFFIQSAVGISALASGKLALAAEAVKETDPQAVGLGYKIDGTKVDKAKFPKYAAGQICSNCVLYQGKPTDAAGGCAIFPGKQVAGKAWCSAYAKKA